MSNLDSHYKPTNFSDKVALSFTKFLRFLADTFFKKRYGHRAVVLETVAAVPGMVAGMLIHLKSLRKMEDDKGWIKTLLDGFTNISIENFDEGNFPRKLSLVINKKK